MAQYLNRPISIGNGGGASNASQLSFSPITNISSTNVQAAITELDSKVVRLIGNQTIGGIKSFSDTTEVDGLSLGSAFFAGGITIAKSLYLGQTTSNHNVYGTLNLPTTSVTNLVAGKLSITNNTASTSSSSGALVVTGGVGIGGNLNVSGSSNSIIGNLTIGSNSSSEHTITGRAYFITSSVTHLCNGLFSIANTTASSSNTTGALTVAGGLGVAGTINANTLISSGNTVVNGSLTSNGTVILGNSTENYLLVGNVGSTGTSYLYLRCASGANKLISFLSGSTEQWRLGSIGSASNAFRLTDVTTSTDIFSISLGANQPVTFNRNLSSPQYATPKQTLTPTGTTQTIDWNSGSFITLNLSSATGNVTLTLNNPNHTSYLVEVIQGGTARNIIFPAGTLQAGGGGNTYVGASNRRDLVGVTWNGSIYLINSVQGYS